MGRQGQVLGGTPERGCPVQVQVLNNLPLPDAKKLRQRINRSTRNSVSDDAQRFFIVECHHSLIDNDLHARQLAFSLSHRLEKFPYRSARFGANGGTGCCLLYTSDAADDLL